MKIPIISIIALLLVQVSFSQDATSKQGKRWSQEKAIEWYAEQPWMVGANFNPSTAINQLEMWQADTFDPDTIDRELGYTKGIGFNIMRVYLHSLAYKADPEGFKKRMERYLTIAHSHDIKTMFVFFDDVWGTTPKAGEQPEPKPGIHNSGWVQDPGDPMSKNTENFPELKIYVQDVLKTFANDKRVVVWDLYNEPGNSKKGNTSIPLLKAVFEWAREINPSQPLTVGIWKLGLTDLNAIQALNSDIITYHNYSGEKDHQKVLHLLKSHGRPMICTEYMARSRDSKFANILPLLKKENVGAINWGLVAGKSNTIYQWDNPIENGEEPLEWFHDVFRKDGTPYRDDEVRVIKKLVGKE